MDPNIHYRVHKSLPLTPIQSQLNPVRITPSCLGPVLIQGRDISVGIATGYGLDGPGSIPVRVKILLSSTESTPAVEPIKWVAEALFLGGNAAGREAGHSPPTSAEIKSGRVIPPLS
jgi:hypothetical protein